MTKLKLCGLSQPQDIEATNALMPDYIGFVFAPHSRRFVTPQQARALKEQLNPLIQVVGVFVDEAPQTVANLLRSGVIDLAQLHGGEDEGYIRRLRELTEKPLIQAFRIKTPQDLRSAQCSRADYVLLDSGAGTGTVFDWTLLQEMKRPYFLAGGLTCGNVGEAIHQLHPYGVDVSSGIETEGQKDPRKMAAFAAMVRKEENG